MNQDLAVTTLAWDEVAPHRHPFDPERGRAVVAGLGPAATVPVRAPGSQVDWNDTGGEVWATEMTRALVREYGRWAAGWRWARDEGDIGGGPVGAWCCPTHSITTREETLERVAAALLEWRGWLEELAERFERFPLGDGDRRATWERGAANLMTLVVERTEAGDAWYDHCWQVLVWFLARWGVPQDRARRLAGEAIGGRFESWIAPQPAVLDEVAGRLADSLTDEDA